MIFTHPLPRIAVVAAGLLLAATAAPAATGNRSAASLTAAEPAAISRFVLADAQIDGVPATELSGLAWDADEKLLYAVSDQGYVYHFRLSLDGDTLAAVEPVYAARLNDKDGNLAPRDKFNAEGLALQHAADGKPGNTVLVVAMEGDQPTVARFTPTGVALGAMTLPAAVANVETYQKKGRGLESLALDPVHGIITTPESPLESAPEGRHTLYSDGQQWTFAAFAPDSRLKGLAELGDGNLLVLERSDGPVKKTRVASVRRVNMAACALECATQTLLVLPPSHDNFEGMTVLDDNRALLVSDNGSKSSGPTTFVLVKFK